LSLQLTAEQGSIKVTSGKKKIIESQAEDSNFSTGTSLRLRKSEMTIRKVWREEGSWVNCGD
jgi:hypothetical protein